MFKAAKVYLAKSLFRQAAGKGIKPILLHALLINAMVGGSCGAGPAKNL